MPMPLGNVSSLMISVTFAHSRESLISPVQRIMSSFLHPVASAFSAFSTFFVSAPLSLICLSPSGLERVGFQHQGTLALFRLRYLLRDLLLLQPLLYIFSIAGVGSPFLLFFPPIQRLPVLRHLILRGPRRLLPLVFPCHVDTNVESRLYLLLLSHLPLLHNHSPIQPLPNVLVGEAPQTPTPQSGGPDTTPSRLSSAPT